MEVVVRPGRLNMDRSRQLLSAMRSISEILYSWKVKKSKNATCLYLAVLVCTCLYLAVLGCTWSRLVAECRRHWCSCPTKQARKGGGGGEKEGRYPPHQPGKHPRNNQGGSRGEKYKNRRKQPTSYSLTTLEIQVHKQYASHGNVNVVVITNNCSCHQLAVIIANISGITIIIVNTIVITIILVITIVLTMIMVIILLRLNHLGDALPPAGRGLSKLLQLRKSHSEKLHLWVVMVITMMLATLLTTWWLQ